VEASALQQQAGISGLSGRSPLLRLRSDEQLVAATRRGNQAAFEALVQRYQPRLLAFCRHMLGSKEDAEDVLQEVFAASYNALLADDRPINTRPWLYRIARNRCLNHLRKPRSAGQDSMDIFERDNGTTTADTVHSREEFRQIVADVGELPETQRTALLLREIDALSYEQIAEAMDTTVPSVKSLLVRARVSLAEAAEARLLTCAEVRLELGEVAEGLAKTSPPVRRHLKSCKRCRTFRDELRNTSKALAAVYPIGPLIALQQLGVLKLVLGKLGFGGAAASSAAGGSGAAAGGAGLAAGGAAAATGGAAAATSGAAAAGGALSAITGTLASKTAAGMAAAAIVTAGAVEVKDVTQSKVAPPPAVAVSAHPAPPAVKEKPVKEPVSVAKAPEEPAPVVTPAVPPPVAVEPAPVTVPTPVTPPETVQEEEGTVTLPETSEPTTPVDEGTATDPETTPPPEPPPATAPAPPPAAVAPTPPPSAQAQGGQTTPPVSPPPPPAD
jgi:RNA polymerase sigma factor (sigma-70 family)